MKSVNIAFTTSQASGLDPIGDIGVRPATALFRLQHLASHQTTQTSEKPDHNSRYENSFTQIDQDVLNPKDSAQIND
jgi:hypothetical protein